MELDRQPRYAPSKILILAPGPKLSGMEVPVIEYRSFPPGQHPSNCPLTPTMTALELVTPKGSRWFGVEKAWINSELRMVVSGINKRDEVRMRWDVCKHP